jgi:transcriptional regulator of met regulon
MEDYSDMATANPAHGEKRDFRKITVTLPPGAYNQLIQESARRKMAKEPNQLLSALLREAVMEYLKRMGKSTSDLDTNHSPITLEQFCRPSLAGLFKFRFCV